MRSVYLDTCAAFKLFKEEVEFEAGAEQLRGESRRTEDGDAPKDVPAP